LWSDDASSFLGAEQNYWQTMKNTKFVVRVNRGGHASEYVQWIDRIPIQMTSNRKLALVMGRFTAEDAVKSIQTSRRTPELVPVEVVPGTQVGSGEKKDARNPFG
jgi:hypothetical protein